MSKLQNMRGIEITPFRAVSSGLKTFEELFGENGFSVWMEEHSLLLEKHVYEPTDFIWHEDEKNIWIAAIRDEVSAADVLPYEIFDFPGGMFLVATGDEKDNDDLEETINCMMEWIQKSNLFEYGDFPKSGMCNMPNAEGIFDRAMGIAQQQIYLPLKLRRP